MKKTGITKNNKLIAEFMGQSDKLKDSIEYGNFHISWDCLMPVLRKIRIIWLKFEWDTEDYDKCEEIFHLDYTLSELLSADITSIYNRIVDFIKWYNTNKNNG